MSRLFGVLILCTASSMAMAVNVDDVAMPKTYNNMFVSDTADIISEVEEKQLDDALNAHFEETGNQIAVVTTVDTKGSGSPKMFATKLFNSWGLGDADKDNGLLILLSISDRRIEFETGYGLEGILPDVTQFRIQQQQMVPYFKKGDYEQGLLRGTYATLNKIKEGMDSELALSQADIEKAQAELEAVPLAKLPENTVGIATPDNSDMPIFLSLLMGFGLIVSSGAGVLYLNRLLTGSSKKQDSSPSLSSMLSTSMKSGDENENENGKKYCGYCHKSTHQTPVIGTSFKKMNLSPYQRQLVCFNAGKIQLLMCDICSYINTDLDISKKLTTCTVCGEKAHYELLNCKMLFKNYLNIYVDRVNRVRDLKDVNLVAVADNWQKNAYVTLTINHCFSCFFIKSAPLVLSIPKPTPKHKPTTTPTSSSKNRYNKDDDDDYSGGYRSRSSGIIYGSSSSSGSGSSWGSGNSGHDFGGGSSGGGGAGSDW